jgi:hypothetical protein
LIAVRSSTQKREGTPVRGLTDGTRTPSCPLAHELGEKMGRNMRHLRERESYMRREEETIRVSPLDRKMGLLYLPLVIPDNMISSKV